MTTATLTAPDLTDLSIANEDFRIIRIDRRGITVCGESHHWICSDSLVDMVDALIDTDSGSRNALTTKQFLARLAVHGRSAASHNQTGDYEVTVDRRVRGLVGRWVRFGFGGKGIVQVATMADLEGRKVAVQRNDGTRQTAHLRNPESHGDGWTNYWVDTYLDSVA